MRTPSARLSHRLPRRVRIKVHAHKGDVAYFDRAKKLVGSYPGVETVHANSRTGSLLIRHMGQFEFILKQAEEDLLFSLVNLEPEETLLLGLLPLPAAAPLALAMALFYAC
jgi:hypothetical protein